MNEKCPMNGKSCNKPKNIHISSNTNGEVSEFDCCQECGGNPSFMLVPLGLMSLLSPMVVPAISVLLNNFAKLNAMDRDQTVRCVCGTSIQDIKNSGRAGCPSCYTTFKDEFSGVMPRMHAGGVCHKGKTPKNNIQLLNNKMAEAVADERYEDAAKFRDQIKVLKQQTFQRNDLEAPDKGI